MEEERHPLLPSRAILHARRSRWRTRIACGTVLLTEILERVAFYGAVGNLVMFLNQAPLNWTSYNATNALFLFTGFSYITALFGGWIADSLLGRFRTILLFFLFYLAGYILLPLLRPNPDLNTSLTHPPEWCYSSPNTTIHNMTMMTTAGPSKISINNAFSYNNGTVPATCLLDSFIQEESIESPCSWAVYLALTLMAVGNGAVKANISPFGADQVKHEGPLATRIFFNWFYWCINIGALIALGGLAYVQQEISFFWGFVAPNISLALAVIVFVCGGVVYVMKKPEGSVITNIIKILTESCRLKFRHHRQNSQIDENSDLLAPSSPSNCLDYSKIRYGGSFHDNMVDDVKTVGKIICIFLSLIPYWAVYFQMQTTFLIQGLHMRLDFGNTTDPNNTVFQIPAAWLSLFDVIFLIILIPLMDRVIYPYLDRKGFVLSLRIRILVGMLFSVAAVVVAGVVEWYRLKIYEERSCYIQTIGNTKYRAAHVTVLLQIPQYALIGLSEVFTSVAGLELAYTEAPRTMQSIIMGLFWFCQGLGSLLGTATVTAFKNVWFFNWDHGDINCQNIPCPNNPKELCSCHLDYYFYFLAGLQVFGFFLFVFFAWMLSMGAMGRSQRRPGAGSPPSASSNQSSPQRSVRTLLDSASHVQQDQGSSYAYSSGDTDIAS